MNIVNNWRFYFYQCAIDSEKLQCWSKGRAKHTGSRGRSCALGVAESRRCCGYNKLFSPEDLVSFRRFVCWIPLVLEVKRSRFVQDPDLVYFENILSV